VERLSRPIQHVPPLLRRQRDLILVTLLGLAAAGWVVVLTEARQPMEMDQELMAVPDLTMGRSWGLFYSMWVAMMVAMMFPAAAPMVLMYARMQRGKPDSIVLFVGSYLALWVAFGALAFGLSVLVEVQASRSEWLGMNWARAGGLLILLAGLYQLTPLKDMCLRHCRTPLFFVMSHWRDGRVGALRMGLTHGLFCMGCCWMLFLVLVPLGVMNVAAMIAVTIVVFAEKLMPWGRGFGRVASAALIVYGGLVILRPGLLPTVT
jgi:predicted metal-binding membrane protein